MDIITPSILQQLYTVYILCILAIWGRVARRAWRHLSDYNFTSFTDDYHITQDLCIALHIFLTNPYYRQPEKKKDRIIVSIPWSIYYIVFLYFEKSPLNYVLCLCVRIYLYIILYTIVHDTWAGRHADIIGLLYYGWISSPHPTQTRIVLILHGEFPCYPNICHLSDNNEYLVTYIHNYRSAILIDFYRSRTSL